MNNIWIRSAISFLPPYPGPGWPAIWKLVFLIFGENKLPDAPASRSNPDRAYEMATTRQCGLLVNS